MRPNVSTGLHSEYQYSTLLSEYLGLLGVFVLKCLPISSQKTTRMQIHARLASCHDRNDGWNNGS